MVPTFFSLDIISLTFVPTLGVGLMYKEIVSALVLALTNGNRTQKPSTGGEL